MISDPTVWRTLECLKRVGIITDEQMGAALAAEWQLEQEAAQGAHTVVSYRRHIPGVDSGWVDTDEYGIALTTPPPRRRWWQRRKRLRTP